MQSSDEPCVLHSPLMKDTPTVAKAYGTLPAQLYIAQKDGMLDQGVFARTAIPHPTVFGPLVAPLTRQASVTFTVDQRFGLRDQNSRIHGVQVFDLDCDDRCNWVKFVREAVRADRQNLVAFCHNDAVYLATTKDIPADTELSFWYSERYGQLLNKENLALENLPSQGYLPENDENEIEAANGDQNEYLPTSEHLCDVAESVQHSLADFVATGDCPNNGDADDRKVKKNLGSNNTLTAERRRLRSDGGRPPATPVAAKKPKRGYFYGDRRKNAG
ncbi:PR domain zinc finger protein 10-like isoform X2 [Paramacrobiotus metropolitanus]|nr:PR domain zinc finger protein 10-like isoform X2 [Paramacrobiotus metropolitanus]